MHAALFVVRTKLNKETKKVSRYACNLRLMETSLYKTCVNNGHWFAKLIFVEGEVNKSYPRFIRIIMLYILKRCTVVAFANLLV